MNPEARRPFRISVRSLMIVIALFALFIMPLAYKARQVEQERRRAVAALMEAIAARDAALAARNAELKARIEAEAARQGTPPAKDKAAVDSAAAPQ